MIWLPKGIQGLEAVSNEGSRESAEWDGGFEKIKNMQ